MKKTLRSGLLLIGLSFMGLTNQAQSYTENFDNVSGLVGWHIQNISSPLGSNSWYQGVPTTNSPDPGPFNAYNGADNSYIAANFNGTTGGSGTINNWLLTPNRIFRNGDVFTFYTRKPTVPNGGTDFPDRLQVRLSTNGASTNVGTNAGDVGDFTTLLLNINATLAANVYPQVWTQYTITISGLPAPTSGRIGFRYFVTQAGPNGTNSDYIGIDNVVYTQYVCPAFTMTPGGALTGGTAGSAYSTGLSQIGSLGAPNYAVTAGALPPGVTLSANGTISGTPTATGTFNFTVTVNDASGCSGSQAYSITVVCPANPTSFSPVTVCSNDGPLTLTTGSPAGGTYSGTGVSGGQFDPAAGTQTVTYDYTDPYGCPFSSNTTITVNTAPTVTLAAFDDVCSNDLPIALSGGSPAGGTFSGTGVSNGEFDPASGTQAITYSYTDANGCSNEDTESITVNEAPTVTLAAFGDVCSNDFPITLSGESPAGGTFTGTGVSNGEFDPASGTQAITYSYTDANGCSNEATESITVNEAPTVTHGPVADVCENASPIALSGASPLGGTYTGTGITGNDFDPSQGTQTITYSYTDANGCTSDVDFTINVNDVPVVSHSALAACNNAEAFTLSGGTPAGGVYTFGGSPVTTYDPADGAATFVYTYTDANGCIGTTSVALIINTAPQVAFTLPGTVCINANAIALNATPAGGTYTGPGVSGTNFTPSAAGLGSHTVTYEFTAGNGCSDEGSATIEVTACASIGENALETAINAYPNPSNGIFTLSVNNINSDIVVEVFNIQGKRVYTAQAAATDGYSQTIDISNFANGIYQVRVSNKTSVAVKTIVKQ